MREFRTSGSVRGALSNERPYRDYEPHKSVVDVAWRMVTLVSLSVRVPSPLQPRGHHHPKADHLG